MPGACDRGLSPLGKDLRPSSGRMAVAAQAGVPSAFDFTVAPPGQQRSMKSGRGRPA